MPLPPLQHQGMDWLELMHRQHTMRALIEVDVTAARQAIRDYRVRTGAPLSLTAFLIACLARAIDADRAMQAYRLGRRQLVLFADVDVTTMVEREYLCLTLSLDHDVIGGALHQAVDRTH